MNFPKELLFPILFHVVSGNSLFKMVSGGFSYTLGFSGEVGFQRIYPYEIFYRGLKEEGFEIKKNFIKDSVFDFDGQDYKIWVDKAIEEDRPEAEYLKTFVPLECRHMYYDGKIAEKHLSEITEWYIRLYYKKGVCL